MHSKDLVEELKKCTTKKDIENLFLETKFPNVGNSNFFDKSITLIDSGLKTTNFVVKLTGIIELAFRVILYLKLDGKFGSKPLKTGEKTYFSTFHTLLKDLTIINKEINIVSDLSSIDLNMYLLQKMKEDKPATIKRKIDILKDWILIYNDYLPYSLRLDENLLTESVEYDELIEKYKEDLASISEVNKIKKVYPLNELKVIISNSIEYMDLYSNDIFEIASHYVSLKSYEIQKHYSISFKYLKNTTYKFKEPSLLELQKSVSQHKNMNKNVNNRYVKSIEYIKQILRQAIERFEVSCISIVLMLTGMRVGEFTTLDRKLKITSDEHFKLERVIFKTSDIVDGDPFIMPIPSIGKKALECLSKFATIKDNGKNTNLIVSSIDVNDIKPVRTTRINHILEKYCDDLGVTQIEPHQFRHAMAFLIVHINEKDGLELARTFLGHTSIVMTLQYMGHYNNELSDAIEELTENESSEMVNLITKEIQDNRKLFGINGRRLMPNNKFMGEQVNNFVKLLRKGLLKLIEEKKLSIIQTPVCLCMHDLSKVKEMECQRGFNISKIETFGPAPSNCKGATCKSSIFFENHIEKLKKDIYKDVDPVLKARLEENSFFMESGGFENEPFRKILKEYDDYKKEVI